LLQIGAIGALDLSLPKLLAAKESRSGGTAARADSCILVFLNGGPSHLDTWDMKPDLPQEMRSEFKPIATSLPGTMVCEHLPKLSKLIDRITQVRSVHHDQVAHAPAVYTALTGVKNNVKAGIVGAKPTDHPAMGSVLGAFRPSTTQMMPYVMMPYITQEGAGGPPQPGYFAGILGKGHDPFVVLAGAKDSLVMPMLAPLADITTNRVKDRQSLLSDLNRDAVSSLPTDLARFQTRACDLLTSAEAQQAFRLDREPSAMHEAYGRNVYGQCMLLARRVIEAGARLACVSWAPNANATWDTHGQNFSKLKKDLLPPFDLSISALLTDLHDRGLLDRTLVCVMGEIGRTPKINSNAGRDHWEFCYTVLFAGAGTKPGFIYGSSDKRGAYPKSNPVTASDIIATIYDALGLPPDLELRDRQNRPLFLVPDGMPIREIFT
jgi:hypothetical protein